jgi:tetratricopeptide (TPR) repeat protein
MAESLERAVGLAPGNPRVLLLDAINTFHMPGFVGGGPKKALEKLEPARAAFEAEPMTAERWGHEDVYIWLGRVAMQQDDWAAAERWLRKALELKPDHAWVVKGLMPKVEAGLAKQAG